MTATRPPAAVTVDPARRSARILLVVALPPAVVAAVIGLLVQGVILLIVLFVVVGVGSAALVWSRAAGRTDELGGSPADPERHARLYNLVDGLCVSAGVRVPAIRVLDVPGCNLAVGGRDAAHSAIVVTAGLLEDLTRMELEGVLAAGIVELRHGDAVPATVAAAAGAFAVRFAVDADHDRRIDDAAVALTRYPPGLTSAYRKLEEHGTVVPGTPRRVAHLWLADPDTAAGAVPYRASLQMRIDALAES